jgi:hypothetical protein
MSVICNQLTWLIAQEDSISFNQHESLDLTTWIKAYITNGDYFCQQMEGILKILLSSKMFMEKLANS